MENQFYDDEEEEERRERRRRRMAEMKRQKRIQERRREQFKKLGMLGIAALLLIILLIVGIVSGIKGMIKRAADHKEEQEISTEADILTAEAEPEEPVEEPSSVEEETEEVPAEPGLGVPGDRITLAADSGNAAAISGDVNSQYGILVDVNAHTVVAQREAHTVMNPASMTKVLTVLVAAEHVKNLDDTVTITIDITDYVYQNDCSAVGFAEGETVTVRDLFYGTVLPSGGDAALALATYVAGSPEAFIDMMNEKIDELGLGETAHMTNCIGVYDENHHCTVYDMAMIMQAAIQNEFCKEVLSAHTYTTSSTTEHPEGITISNWFLRRIEDKDAGGTVVAGKTGYVVQSGNCAASFAEGADGKSYICVTGNAHSAWRCIYDHVEIYKKYFS